MKIFRSNKSHNAMFSVWVYSVEFVSYVLILILTIWYSYKLCIEVYIELVPENMLRSWIWNIVLKTFPNDEWSQPVVYSRLLAHFISPSICKSKHYGIKWGTYWMNVIWRYKCMKWLQQFSLQLRSRLPT